MPEQVEEQADGKLARLLAGCCAICSLTLDRPSLDKSSGFIKSKKAVPDCSVKLGECICVFGTMTGGITAKRMLLCVEGLRGWHNWYKNAALICLSGLTGKAAHAILRRELSPFLTGKTKVSAAL